MTSMDQFAIRLPDGTALHGGGGSLQRMLVPVSTPGDSAAALALAARACTAVGGILRVVRVRLFFPPVRGTGPFYPVLIGTVVTLAESIAHPGVFTWSITAWLALTVLFASFAEAVSEGRGKAQADTLRKMRSDTLARRLGPDGAEELVPAAGLARGDLVVCEAGDVIPSDGEIVEGLASVDESAITGESAR
jgi:potassium-transporting ATPase ATP-binding subunit